METLWIILQYGFKRSKSAPSRVHRKSNGLGEGVGFGNLSKYIDKPVAYLRFCFDITFASLTTSWPDNVQSKTVATPV
jgi:hypothetical protein